MGAALFFKLTVGICFFKVFFTNVVGEIDTLVTWSDARDFCDSINASLVDPLVDVVATDGAFWTNRRMETQSSWIYVRGCISTSSLGSDSSRGREVSSVWECDNLCDHTESFGIQNSTCFCLKTDIPVDNITQENVCPVKCDNCTDDFPIQCCSHLVTVYRKYPIPGIAGNSSNDQCLARVCDDDIRLYKSYPCSVGVFRCTCGNEELSYYPIATDWRTCFKICEAKGNFILTKQFSLCKGPAFRISWLPVRRMRFDDNTGLCYRCIDSTLNCEYQKCDHNYTVYCKKNSILYKERLSSAPANSTTHSSSKLLSTPATNTTIISFTRSSTARKTSTVTSLLEHYQDHGVTIRTAMAVVFSLVAVSVFVGIPIFCIRQKICHREDQDGPRSQNEGGLVTYDEIQLTEPKPSIHCYDRLGDVDKEKGYTNSHLYANTTEFTTEQNKSGDGESQLYSNLRERSSGPVEDFHIYSHVVPDDNHEYSTPGNEGF